MSFSFVSPRRISDGQPPLRPVDGPYAIDAKLSSAASTLASIVSRQAFDIPRKSSDSLDDRGHRRPPSDDGDRDSVFSGGRGTGGRRSLPHIGTAGDDDSDDDTDDGGVGRTRRDSGVGDGGVPAGRQDAPAPAVHRDPFGSPVTPKAYNGFRRRAAAVVNAPR